MKTRNIAVLSTLSLALALTAAPTSFANPVSPDVTVNNPLVSTPSVTAASDFSGPYPVNGNPVVVPLRGELRATVIPNRYDTFYFKLTNLQTGEVISNQVYSGSSQYGFRISNNSVVGTYSVQITSSSGSNSGTFMLSYLE